MFLNINNKNENQIENNSHIANPIYFMGTKNYAMIIKQHLPKAVEQSMQFLSDLKTD